MTGRPEAKGQRSKQTRVSRGSDQWRAIASLVERWFRANKRPLPWREAYEPWHVWVSEVMAQQTRMDVVVARFPELVARFPTIESMARASEADVVAAWSGLGYYRRARMLHRGACEVMSRFGGELPAAVEALRSIPGVGRYTAGSIGSIAFGLPAAIVDGNVARVVARLDMIDAPLKSGALEKRAWELAEALVGAARRPRDFNQGLMELGARVCTPQNPACDGCPLTAYCRAFEANRVEEFPVRVATKRPVDVAIPLYVFTDKSGRVLFRRGEGKLMHDMLHLPHGSDALYPHPLKISKPGPVVGTVKHSITSRRITFEVHCPAPGAKAVADAPGEWLWLAPEELASHAHPSYVRKALQLIAALRATEGRR
ncbi:MAG: A/G-specific adenine glycosylase [Thermoanaerobaculia bacterium]|nr:A/G-specific adenine glycosylase [Thermoanaerobaculia bacterium]